MPTNPPSPQLPGAETNSSTRVALLAFGLLGVGLFIVGYWRIFTQFMGYDDEGHFLWSLREYAAHGGLYDTLKTLYQPGYFVAYHFLQLAGLDLNHDTGRLLTLLSWCGTVMLCGWFSWRQTRSIGAGLAAATLTFVSLITVIKDPMHPSTLLMPAAALGAVLGASVRTRTRPLWFAGITATLAAAMLLTKINVGAFFLMSVGTWLAINSRKSARARSAALLAGLACVLGPYLLMRPQWPHPWVTTYTLVFACGALALGGALYEARQPEHGLRSWGLAISGATVIAVIIFIAASANGTRWSALWEGTVGVPQRFAQANMVPLAWPGGAGALALVMAAVAGVYYFRRNLPGLIPTLALLRIVAGGWFLATISKLTSEPTALQEFCFFYGPSLAWLMAVPLRTAPTPADRARLWLAWVFIWQTLQAYPVAGSQIGWGSFLWVPLFVAGWHEAVLLWMERLDLAARRGVRPAAAFVLTIAAIAALWPIGSNGYERFTANEPLGLPGAARLRLRHDYTSDFRILHQNLRLHAGSVYGFTETLSLNVWTGHRRIYAPTAAPGEQESAIAREILAEPKSVVVLNYGHMNLLELQGQSPKESPIYNCITQHFAPVFRVDDYELWVQRGRRVAPFSIAYLARASSEGRLQLQLTLEALPRPIAAVVLARFDGTHQPVLTLPLDAAQSWQLTPIALTGEAAGPTTTATGPANITQPARLTLEFTPTPDLLNAKGIEIRLLDAAGGCLARLRLGR